MSQIDRREGIEGRAWISGKHDFEDLQRLVFKFIRETVCPMHPVSLSPSRCLMYAEFARKSRGRGTHGRAAVPTVFRAPIMVLA